MNSHELIQDLKRVAGELGKVPSRAEYLVQGRFTRREILKQFDNYSVFLVAAGFTSSRPKKIDSSIFNSNIETHLEQFKPRLEAQILPTPRMAIISDIHFPFTNKRVLEKFYRRIEKTDPEWVILNGDAWDMYSHAKFPRSHNVFTPRDEENLSRKMNEDFWIEVKKAAPRSTCVQMLGNHDIRPMKRILETYPEAEDWVKERLTRIFTFDGVRTVFDPREEIFPHPEIAVFHGYRTKLGDHRDYTHFCTINGHSHSGGVVFRRIRGKTLWELNSGYAGDPEAKGLTYTPQRITHWTPGFGAVDEDGPRFIPA